MSNNTIKPTRTDLEMVRDFTLDECEECGDSITVEKEMKAAGRKSRCVPCLVRSKTKTGGLI